MYELAELRTLIDKALVEYVETNKQALAMHALSAEPTAESAMRIIGGSIRGAQEFAEHLINTAREDSDDE